MLFALAVSHIVCLVLASNITYLADELIRVSLQVVLLRRAVLVQLLLAIRLELAGLTIEAFEFSFATETIRVQPMTIGIREGAELSTTATLVVLVETVDAGSIVIEMTAYLADVVGHEDLTAVVAGVSPADALLRHGQVKRLDAFSQH